MPSDTYELEVQPGHSAVELRPKLWWELVRDAWLGTADSPKWWARQ